MDIITTQCKAAKHARFVSCRTRISRSRAIGQKTSRDAIFPQELEKKKKKKILCYLKVERKVCVPV